MNVILVGVQKSDRDRLDRLGAPGFGCALDRGFVERHENVAVGIDAFGDLDAQTPWYQRRRALDGIVVEIGAGLSADLEDIAKPGGGQQRGGCTATLDDQIGDDGRTMAEKADRLARSAGLFEQRCDPARYRDGRVGWGRRQFEMLRRAGCLIDGDQISKGAADIDADPDHKSSNARVRAVSCPVGVNGLWISTPLSVEPSAMSSVRISSQPASAAVATSSASQYDARPATESASAARTASAEAAVHRNATRLNSSHVSESRMPSSAH